MWTKQTIEERKQRNVARVQSDNPKARITADEQGVWCAYKEREFLAYRFTCYGGIVRTSPTTAVFRDATV